MLLSAAAYALLLGGCAQLQQSGLVYSSKNTIGAKIDFDASNANPVSITLGYGSVDVAYVPVAVSKDGKEITSLAGQHDEEDVKCKNLKSVLKAAAADDKTVAAAQLLCERRKDAFSVYGQFNGTATADAAAKGAGLTAGRIFATGIAAQQISEGAGLEARARCIEQALKAVKDGDAKDAVVAKLCGTVQ